MVGLFLWLFVAADASITQRGSQVVEVGLIVQLLEGLVQGHARALRPNGSMPAGPVATTLGT